MIDSIARSFSIRAYKLAGGKLSMKNNMEATSIPTATDDEDAGYIVGSIWMYDNTTYTCVDSSVGKAVWNTSSDIVSFNSWAEVIAAISVLSPSYIGKYALVANANGAPSANITYIAPEILNNYIVDGGSATLKINAQGENYSVTTMPRTITNPVVTSVMLTSATRPTTRGYYIFAVAPSNGLPSGVNINDICYYDGYTWGVWQTYSLANTVLVVGNSANTQVTWRKFNGTWMSTADDYTPDGKEYQTGKLYNGKAVYRRTYSGTLTGSTQQVATGIPRTGTVILVLGTFVRSSGTTQSVYSTLSFSVNASGVLNANNSDQYNNGAFLCWCEYTKS